MSSKSTHDILIVGAGPVGCIFAERCATQLNKRVLLIDKRSHLAGNCYDQKHESGVLIHKYGPHYFRTNNRALIDYLSQFTDWIEGNYFVTSYAREEQFPFPINLLTLAQFFKKESLTPEQGYELLESKKEKIAEPKNSEEYVLSRVGKELYEAFYLNYTIKQWGIHPRDLSPSVCGRIPVRLNENCSYVDHTFQMMPKDGFTVLFEKMVRHPLIEKRLNTNFRDIEKKPGLIVYTGPIDEYFNYCYGKLDWRSLEFEFKEYSKEYVQNNVQINYPNDYAYTRSVEIKHVTRQKHPSTVVSYEYPKAHGEPYYPIPTDTNNQLYEKYRQLAEKETLENKVIFCGRLAEYKYFNTDEVIERALSKFETIRNW